MKGGRERIVFAARRADAVQASIHADAFATLA